MVVELLAPHSWCLLESIYLLQTTNEIISSHRHEAYRLRRVEMSFSCPFIVVQCPQSLLITGENIIHINALLLVEAFHN